MQALKAAIQKEMNEAVQEATVNSYNDLHRNVSHFYDAPEGRYRRTGQLKESPQLDNINFDGDNAEGQISIDTNSQYSPAGRSTQTIYEYAEDGCLPGNGGFWDETTHDIERNIEEAFGKRFK